MGRNLFSSLAIKDNLKVAFLEKNSNNPKIYLVTMTAFHWDEAKNLSLMSNDENKFLPIFQILHINNVLFLLELALALVTSVVMKFAPVWPFSYFQASRIYMGYVF